MILKSGPVTRTDDRVGFFTFLKISIFLDFFQKVKNLIFARSNSQEIRMCVALKFYTHTDIDETNVFIKFERKRISISRALDLTKTSIFDF